MYRKVRWRIKSCVKELSGGKREQLEDFEDEVVARRASTGASPIRSSNFHLITALIKANRSERKHQFHYSELTVSCRMIKGRSASRIPHSRTPFSAVLIAKITTLFDPEKFTFSRITRFLSRSPNSSVVNNNSHIRRPFGHCDRAFFQQWKGTVVAE